MKKILLILFTVFYVTTSFSQNMMVTRKWRNKENDSLVKAQTIFEARNYPAALGYFEKILANHPNELYLKYVVGVCGLYRSDMHEKSLEYLSETYVKNRKTNDIEYDLARAQHYNYRFDDALTNIDDYLKRKGLTEVQKREAHLLQDFCNNAKELVAKPVNAKIENLGNTINTVNSEYSPAVTADENTIIFTYIGEESTGGKQNELNLPDPYGDYNEDIFTSHKEGGKWVKPVGISPLINSNLNDASISISNDGQKLFIFKDDGSNGGDIYVSTLTGDNWSAPEKLRGDVNTDYWEGSASLAADGKTLYFSSERPGGIGGKDIYKAILQADGTWKQVENLGIDVNTSFDDDDPFIHPDGTTLFYSTQGLKSMGYNDIFVTRYNDKDTTWSKPENIGYPINTTDDDRCFSLSPSGDRGYYSSGKKGGFGEQDIYSVDMPSTFRRPVVATVKGQVTVNGKPGEATIQIDIVNKNSNYGNFGSNSASGKYLVIVPPGNSYKITFKAEGFPPQVQTLDFSSLTAFTEKTINIQFPLPGDAVANTAVTPGAAAATTETPGATTEKATPVATTEKANPVATTEKATSAPGTEKSAVTPIEKSNPATAGNPGGTAKKEVTPTPTPAEREAMDAKLAAARREKVAATENKVASKIGDESKAGLIFKIQVAALTNPKNFDYAKIKGLGKVEKTKLDDGITRFTLGKFKTLNEALDFKKKVVGNGVADAFITAIYKGKRVYLTELVTMGLIEVNK